MCWSSSASIASTVVGSVATVYAAKKGYPKAQVFALGFFTFMEFLQAVSYIWIGQCGAGGNVLLTHLSYLHIAFQPPVFSAFMLSFVTPEKRKKWFKLAMMVSLVSTILLLIKWLAPMVWDVPQEFMCRIGDTMCGQDVCTYRGNWHLAWRLPLLGYIPGNLLYFIPVFIIPIMYGSWKGSLYHFTLGPLLANLLTTDRNESPAIWCLFSITLLCGIFLNPPKKQLKISKRSEKK
jgi:hypothetical protein